MGVDVPESMFAVLRCKISVREGTTDDGLLFETVLFCFSEAKQGCYAIVLIRAEYEVGMNAESILLYKEWLYKV